MYCTLYCTDLVLPMCRHDLGVGAGHLDAGVEAALYMRSLDVPAVDPGSPHPTVVTNYGFSCSAFFMISRHSFLLLVGMAFSW